MKELSQRALEVAQIIDNATPGPWVISIGDDIGPLVDGRVKSLLAPYPSTSRKDLTSVITARNDAPDLLRKLAERVGFLEKVAERLTKEFQVTATGGSIMGYHCDCELYVGSQEKEQELAQYLREVSE